MPSDPAMTRNQYVVSKGIPLLIVREALLSHGSPPFAVGDPHTS